MKTLTCDDCKLDFVYSPRFIFDRETTSPKFCPDCNHKRLLKERGLILAEQWQQMCPPLYKLTDPKKLQPEKLAQILNWVYGPKGLVLHGTTGTGKTRIATLLMKQLFMAGRSVAMFYGMDFAHLCAKKFGEFQGEDWIDSVARKDVVFFDDLGKFPLTERIESELFGLIECRLLNLKPVIITTNFVGEALESKMTADRGEPLVRRLREFCESVAFV